MCYEINVCACVGFLFLMALRAVHEISSRKLESVNNSHAIYVYLCALYNL